MESTGLEQAVAVARENGQVAIWDLAERPWAIALYDALTKQLTPLTDEQVGILLNRDPLIGREWHRWNAMSQNRGSLVVLDGDHVGRVLSEASQDPDDDDETGEAA